MTVELLQILSIVAYIAAGLFFLIAVALFFLLEIPKLYGDISGRTAKKAIEAIRQQNESTGNKAYKPSAVNVERGKLTDEISPSGHLRPHTCDLSVNVGTEKLDTSMLIQQANETTLLVSDVASPVTNQEFPKLTVDVEMSFIGSTEIIE